MKDINNKITNLENRLNRTLDPVERAEISDKIKSLEEEKKRLIEVVKTNNIIQHADAPSLADRIVDNNDRKFSNVPEPNSSFYIQI